MQSRDPAMGRAIKLYWMHLGLAHCKTLKLQMK